MPDSENTDDFLEEAIRFIKATGPRTKEEMILAWEFFPDVELALEKLEDSRSHETSISL